jgi:PPOX class probable F420-dependent enzyme
LYLSTLLPDGSPHSAPVWVDYDADADRVLVNTERGRRKEKNVREDPRVAVSMTDPEDPYRMLALRGEVDELTTEGAREHIDELARRYTGDEYQIPIETERVVLEIAVEHVSRMGE